MIRVGLIGCGAIGTALAESIDRQSKPIARIVALVDREPSQALALQQRLSSSRPACVSLPDAVRRADVLVEAASVAIAADVARRSLRAHRPVLIMSTGGLLLNLASWLQVARRSRGRVVVPSGGLCGLDGVKAMAVGTVTRMQLTTRKPPHSLAGTPGAKASGIALDRLHRPRVLFDGTPQDAITAFPQNTNVAATMAMAYLIPTAPGQPARGLGQVASGTIRVRVVADPTITLNIHELEVEGDCGRLFCRMESRQSPRNPKTSEIAIRSAIVALNQLFTSVRIGT